MPILIADALIEYFIKQGVSNFFTVPGGGAMYLIDALVKNKYAKGVSCHHEQSAAIAAEYSARLNKKTNYGVCVVTSGPGATNAITGLVGSWLESVPVVYLSGQAKSTDLIGHSGVRQIGVQEVDIVSMVKSCTKYAKTWLPDMDFAKELKIAMDAMMTGRRGPIWIDLPLDVQNTFVNENIFKQIDIYNEIGDAKNIGSGIWDLIRQSKRPLLYLGHGVRLSNSNKIAVDVIDSFGVPYVTTWNQMDILPYEHELNFGRPGVVAERYANFAVQNCDLLISIGSRLNNALTAYNPANFAKNATKIIFDIDLNELNINNIPNSIKVQMNARSALNHIKKNAMFENLENGWVEKLRFWKKRYSLENEALISSETLNHYKAIWALSDAIPENRTIITGSSGLAVEAFYVGFKNKHGQRILHTSALGSMGYGVPAAIGAATELSATNNPLYCVEGDGSLHMNLQDIGTLKKANNRVCLIVLNNQGYASIRATQKGYFNERYFGTGKEGDQLFVCLKDVAAMFGYEYIEAKSKQEIKQAVNHFECNVNHLLVDINVMKDEALFPKASVYFDDGGKMHSMPMEDMAPYIDIDELEKEMFHSLPKISYSLREKK